MRIPAFFKSIALLALPAALFFASCDPALIGSGAILTETRTANDFTGLDVSVPGNIYVTQGQTFSVQVRAEENLLPYLQTRVEGKNLHVYFSRNVRSVDGLEVRITMPALKNVQMSGSGRLDTDGAFAGNTLNLGLSGSGRLYLNDMTYPYIAANVSGSGKMFVNGQSEDMDLNMSGSGELDALGCPTKVAEAHLSGSGTIRVRVSETLKAHVSGSGTIWYEGSPSLESHISGSGKVRKL